MDYEIVPVKRENLSLYSRLLSEVFTDTTKFTSAFLNWQYYENPAGEVVGFDAFKNGELAAHYVTIPVVYLFQGKRILGLLSLNTATSKQHQGKGLFTVLANATYEAAKKAGYNFVIGVANQNSTHGFLKKLGFKLISPLDARIYLGSIKTYKVGEEFFRACRDEAFMKWRLNNPEGKYFLDKNIVYSETHIGLIKAYLTGNADSFPGMKPTVKPLVKLVIGLNLSKPSFALRLPDKLKPSPLNLIFKSLSVENLEINAENVLFELIDFDAY